MLGTGASNALLFPAYEHALKTIDSSDKPGLVSVFVAGSVAICELIALTQRLMHSLCVLC